MSHTMLSRFGLENSDIFWNSPRVLWYDSYLLPTTHIDCSVWCNAQYWRIFWSSPWLMVLFIRWFYDSWVHLYQESAFEQFSLNNSTTPVTTHTILVRLVLRVVCCFPLILAFWLSSRFSVRFILRLVLWLILCIFRLLMHIFSPTLIFPEINVKVSHIHINIPKSMLFS